MSEARTPEKDTIKPHDDEPADEESRAHARPQGCRRSHRTTSVIAGSACCTSAGYRRARIGEHVGQRNLAVTANTYSHVLTDEADCDYAKLWG